MTTWNVHLLTQPTWSTLLSRAAAVYDEPNSPLPRAARDAAGNGFRGGAQWMATALSTLRGRDVVLHQASFTRLGIAKYALASAAAILVAGALGILRLWPLVPLAVLAFYVVEVQMLFVFPLAIDGHHRPFRESRRLMLRLAGTARAVGTVLPIAVCMLLGGFLGRGFVRCWCLGCLAICIWYEDARGLPPLRRMQRLEIAGGAAPAVREQFVTIARNSGTGSRRLALLYASDLHLSRPWTRRLVTDLIYLARAARPDAVLLGGDLVDNPTGLIDLRPMVRALSDAAPVYAIAGNHDLRAGVQNVRSAVIASGGQWLDHSPVKLSENVFLCGDSAADVTSIDGVRILCAHDPAVFPSAARAGFDLVLAGHLHGGQCVCFERGGRLYPGACVNRWTGLRFEIGQSLMLVSRGAGDTLPLRWNCPREVLLCRIQH